MNAGELKLASIARALVGDSCALTTGERQLASKAVPLKRNTVCEYRDRIAQGEDVLGSEFCKIALA